MVSGTFEQGVERLALRTILLPRDTNGAGTIFGGIILSQIDLAGAGVARDFSCQRYVTVAMREVEFHQPVYVGDRITYYGTVSKVGRTSITIDIRVEAQRFEDCTVNVPVTNAQVVYVAVDEALNPMPIQTP